ncbi:MAG: nitrogen fixation protein [Acidobacteria bacterium]|nr:nitrogen fixation protein [Acidobacteriota bacterium]
MKNPLTKELPLCPSAQPEMAGCVALGAVCGTVEAPRLEHFAKPLPVNDELLALSAPVKPTEVFRFAAPCAGNDCQHFDGRDCRLVTRVVQILPAAISSLPTCSIRADCRWWQQEGRAACMRCPQIVTECYEPSDEMLRAAFAADADTSNAPQTASAS